MSTLSTLSAPSLARLATIYAGSFAVLGAVMPYLALELREQGVTGLALAAAMGTLPLGRLLAGPAWSVLADATRSQRLILRTACLLAAMGLAALIWGGGMWAVGAVLLFAVGRAPMGPVIDGLTLQALKGDSDHYGSIRRWGSGGYLAATMTVPLLFTALAIPRLLPGLLLTGLLVLLVWDLPDGAPQPPAKLLPALRALGADVPLRWILACAALHFAAHVAATSFLAVHMASLGLSEIWAGGALSLGVIVEIALMSQSRRLLSAVSAERLLLITALVAGGRWVLTALATEGWQLVLLQGSHGFTFGAFWIAAVALVSSRADESVTTSAQGLLAAAVGGVGGFIGLTGASIISEGSDTTAIFIGGAVLAAAASGCAWRAAR
ncbi:MAG: PPP family 3-phenylpropionic acid transporter [Myxococcota bacterium]